MMLYKLMNSEEFKEKSTGFIVGIELADEFIADLYDNEPENLCCEYTEEEIEDILNNNEFFLVSRNYYGEGDVEYFCEPLLHNGIQCCSEADVFFIDDELVDVVDKTKLWGEILTLKLDQEDCEHITYGIGDLKGLELFGITLNDKKDTCERTFTYKDLMEEDMFARMTDDLISELNKAQANDDTFWPFDLFYTFLHGAYDNGYDDAIEGVERRG